MSRSPKLTWSRAFVLVAFIALSAALFLWAREQGQRREPAARLRAAQEEPRPALLLPRRGAGAASLLGKSRTEVRAALGEPSEVVGPVDVFELGVPLRFRFEGDRAKALLVTVKDRPQHDVAVRRWLGLGAGSQVELGALSLAVGSLPGEPETLEVSVVETRRAEAPKVPRRAESGAEKPVGGTKAGSRIVRLAAELLRSFPAIPNALVERCAATERGPVRDVTCADGVDAPVDYTAAKDGSWATLTLLGPPGTDGKAACRQWLLDNVPGARADGRRQQDDELQEYYLRDGTRYLLSYLTLVHAGAGARCSIMACREDGKGHGTACRPSR